MPKAVVVVFLVILGLPLVANVAGRDGADAGSENRTLADFPRYDGTLQSIADYGSRFGNWFDDHFGFRSALVRWYGESRLYLFGTSPTSSVIKGKNGFFFYADDGAMDDFASADPLTQEAIMNWRESLERAHRWLDARHIGYVFVITPDKHVVYAEGMPDSVVRAGTTSRTDQLYGSLVDAGFVVDIRPALFSAKRRERIYFKTDTHWNDRGAQAAYEMIINEARAQVPAIPVAWTRADFEPAVEDVEAGDLAAMMGLKRVLREENLTLRVKRPRLARVVEPTGATELAEVGRLVTEIPASTLPRAVIFRDSFTSRLVPLLSEHFSRAVYLWQNDFDPQVVDQEKPDVVIQQIVGRHLYNFIPSPELVPER
jgi:alginate O-acetyltransferase complex protein AlgJ